MAASTVRMLVFRGLDWKLKNRLKDSRKKGVRLKAEAGVDRYLGLRLKAEVRNDRFLDRRLKAEVRLKLLMVLLIFSK